MKETARGVMINPTAIKMGQESATVDREVPQSHIEVPTPHTEGFVPDMSDVKVPTGMTDGDNTKSPKKTPPKRTPPKKKSVSDHTKVVIGASPKKTEVESKKTEADEEI